MKRWIAIAMLGPLCVGAAHALVNVNTAQQSELQNTKGLDARKAKSIIEYRAEKGSFAKLEDLEQVPGLDKTTVEKIAPQVAFSGPAFVPAKAEPKAKKKS
jgi:competence protein ComEA